MRAYVAWDILRRTLQFNNFKVNHVMNITDVGHLTSDADDGEDKMLKGAKREKKTVWEVAEFYTQAFKSDVKKLNILEPTTWCKATDHIEEQIGMIKKLEQQGYTYQAGGNIYFDTSKFPKYLDLFGIKRDNQAQARVEKDTNKKNHHDFVLWFTKSKFDEQAMKWDSPWGTGYPGWHIECSAMATKYLGEHFDIHCGGKDHQEIHHANEVAQSECASGCSKWVNYWLHNEFLVLDQEEKMSKSKGNFMTLATIEEWGFDPIDYRYFTLTAHYRKQLTLNKEALKAAQSARKKLVGKVLHLKTLANKQAEDKDAQLPYLESFTKAINDDLNTPQALAVVWETLKDDSLSANDQLRLLFEFDSVLGLNLKQVKKDVIPQEILDLAQERQNARANKDWALSDKLRDQIKELGYNVADTKEGFEVRKI